MYENMKFTFLVADDMGFWDVGFKNENRIKTPNLDRLKEEGILLDNYYVQSVCSPTRAVFWLNNICFEIGLYDR